MATAIAPRADARVKEFLFIWEGTDRNNKPMRGEMRLSLADIDGIIPPPGYTTYWWKLAWHSQGARDAAPGRPMSGR